MDSNTSTTDEPEAGPGEIPVEPGGLPAGLEGLAAVIADLAADDPAGLGDGQLAGEVLALRRLADQLEGAWLRRLAAVDARGAAGAEAGVQAGSTAGWLRAALRMSPAGAGRAVRTARALHRGPLGATASALAAGEVSVEHAAVLAEATHDLPTARVAEAEGVLVEAARRLDPGRLRRLTTHLRALIEPDRTHERARVRWERRGLWLSATYDGMVALDGWLDPATGETVRAALAPLARPAGPQDPRSAAQRRADALGELALLGLQGGRLPEAGGVRPQLTVTVELASLLDGHGVGGTGGWGGLLPGGAVRRVACDATVTRVVGPALRRALAVRDGGCVAAGCDRPAPWTDAHHLTHWLDGGATSLDNLVLLCRVHHRAVHEGGWRLEGTGGRHALTPPARHLVPAPAT